MNPGDTDKDGKENDGHAVIITGYDEDHGTVYYWDPETGESGNGAVGDYMYYNPKLVIRIHIKLCFTMDF